MLHVVHLTLNSRQLALQTAHLLDELSDLICQCFHLVVLLGEGLRWCLVRQGRDDVAISFFLRVLLPSIHLVGFDVWQGW